MKKVGERIGEILIAGLEAFGREAESNFLVFNANRIKEASKVSESRVNLIREGSVYTLNSESILHKNRQNSLSCFGIAANNKVEKSFNEIPKKYNKKALRVINKDGKDILVYSLVNPQTMQEYFAFHKTPTGLNFLNELSNTFERKQNVVFIKDKHIKNLMQDDNLNYILGEENLQSQISLAIGDGVFFPIASSQNGELNNIAQLMIKNEEIFKNIIDSNKHLKTLASKVEGEKILVSQANNSSTRYTLKEVDFSKISTQSNYVGESYLL